MPVQWKRGSISCRPRIAVSRSVSNAAPPAASSSSCFSTCLESMSNTPPIPLPCPGEGGWTLLRSSASERGSLTGPFDRGAAQEAVTFIEDSTLPGSDGAGRVFEHHTRPRREIVSIARAQPGRNCGTTVADLYLDRLRGLG